MKLNKKAEKDLVRWREGMSQILEDSTSDDDYDLLNNECFVETWIGDGYCDGVDEEWGANNVALKEYEFVDIFPTNVSAIDLSTIQVIL